MEILKLSGKISVNDIPERIASRINATNLPELKARLKEGGVLIFENAQLEIGEINLNSNSYFSIGVHELIFKRSTITTNGNTLEVYCDKIEMDDSSKIIAFDTRKAKSGKNGTKKKRNGGHGSDGDGGGVCRLNITDKIVNKIEVNLSAEHGGDGGDGKKGKTGKSGKNSWRGDFGTCRRGPGDGKRGGRGGNGGDAGDGGDGGILYINYIETEVQDGSFVEFLSLEGGPGLTGKLGAGGNGGSAGRIVSECDHHSANAGRKGTDGVEGAKGKPGVLGKSIVQLVTMDAFEFLEP